MPLSKPIQEYRKIQRATFKKVTSEVEGHWRARVLHEGLHKLGEKGAEIYLLKYGKGIGEKKVVHLAIKAEIEGHEDMAIGFWKKAYECSVHPQTTRGTTRKGSMMSKKNGAINILFLASNPRNTPPLQLGEEMHSIDQALLMAQFRDTFSLQQQWAVRTKELSQHFLRHNPNIVHFSGHGNNSSEIVLQDDAGDINPVPTHALSSLFSLFKSTIRCVVLNACYSQAQAEAIAEHIECVIGMSRAIDDTSAIVFATAFYRALGHGRHVKDAFEFGCVQIDLQRLRGPDTPQLLALKTDPTNIYFTKH